MTTLETREPNFARPVAPHRGRIYLGVGLLTGGVFLAMTFGVQFGFIPPTFTSDVIANLLFGIPVLLVPLVILWDAPGENRTRLDKSAELTLFYLPYTACSQIGYELMFLVGHPLGWWTPTTDPGWKWLWWQYASGRHPLRQWKPLDLRAGGGRRDDRCLRVRHVDEVDQGRLVR